MKKTLKWLDLHFEEVVLMVFLVLICAIILFQVFMRYFLKAAQPWPEELSRYLFVFSTMLSLGYCIRNKAMLRIDMIVKALPKLVQDIIDMFISLVSLFLYAYLFYNSFSMTEIARNSTQLSPAMQLPMYILYSTAILGFGLAIIRTIQDIIAAAIKWRGSNSLKKDGVA